MNFPLCANDRKGQSEVGVRWGGVLPHTQICFAFSEFLIRRSTRGGGLGVTSQVASSDFQG